MNTIFTSDQNLFALELITVYSLKWKLQSLKSGSPKNSGTTRALVNGQ